MTRPRHGLRPRAAQLLGALALTLVLVLGGCAPTTTGGPTNQAPVATSASTQQVTIAATATATSAPAPQAHVIGKFSNVVTVGSNSSGSASATCPSGDPLLGGGFIARLHNANGEDGTVPNDSYPSSGTTWKVSVTTLADSVDLTAVAVCLQANFTVTTTIVHASNGGGDTTVTCPGGSIVTGGGFRSGGGTNAASLPKGNGWKISTGIPFGGSASPTVYAVCATQGLIAAGVKTATKTVTDGTVTANGAKCSSGQYPVGGGYNGYLPGSDTFWRVFLNIPETGQGTISSGWAGEVHSGEPASSAFIIYSICATH